MTYRFYLAPLEGITGFLFRSAIRTFFGDGIEKYFTPFFGPSTKRSAGSKEIRDILPDNNKDMYTVPQILTIDPEDFFLFERDVMEYGYTETNINLGCPSNTVSAKRRGAAFLGDPDKLDRFLDGVYSGAKTQVSIKTRLGVRDPEEFCSLLEIYNRYPLKELIVHGRVREEMYRGSVHTDMLAYAVKNSKNPICINGDIKDKASFDRITSESGLGPESEGDCGVMVGRAMVADPSLIRELSGGAPASSTELSAYMEKLLRDYCDLYHDDRNVLHRMKEIWAYMASLYLGYEGECRKIMKSQNVSEYRDRAALVLSLKRS